MIVAVCHYPQSLTFQENASMNIYTPTIVYLIYNPLGENYIGVTTNIQGFHNKTYCGSGNGIKKSIKKYGVENHYFFIIKLFMNEKDAYSLERKLVPWSRVWSDPYCLNEFEGGKGANSGKNHFMYGVKRPEYSKKMTGKNNPMYGNGHLISGIKNSNYGKYGNKSVRYNHNISTQSIINLIIKNTIEINSKLSTRIWNKIAKNNNSMQNFTKRISEINQILNSNCKTVGDVLLHIEKTAL